MLKRVLGAVKGIRKFGRSHFSGSFSTKSVNAEYEIQSKCFFEIEMENETIGKIIIGLYDDVCPITVENFKSLCTGNAGLSYENTPIHRVINNFQIEMGDITNGDGTGGTSIYGDFFPDENFTLSHEQYSVAMINMKRERHHNASIFSIFLNDDHEEAFWMNEENVVFGKVIEGFECIKEIQEVQVANMLNKPMCDLRVIKCGIIN